jgi:hypothetical protein
MVSKVLVSGFEVFRQSKIPSAVAYAMRTMRRLEAQIPRSLLRWLLDGADLGRSENSFCTVAMCRDIALALQVPDIETWTVPSWPAKALIIAAGKSGILPTKDSPDDARRLAAIGRQLNDQTRTVCHPQMRHP